MLPKENRITGKYDYGRVRKFGKTSFSPFFAVSVMKDLKNPNGKPKFGVIVTNKVDKRAAARHRLRRLLYESLYPRLEKFPQGVLVVFIPRPAMIGTTYEEVSSELDTVLSKISFS